MRRDMASCVIQQPSKNNFVTFSSIEERERFTLLAQNPKFKQMVFPKRPNFVY